MDKDDTDAPYFIEIERGSFCLTTNKLLGRILLLLVDIPYGKVVLQPLVLH